MTSSSYPYPTARIDHDSFTYKENEEIHLASYGTLTSGVRAVQTHVDGYDDEGRWKLTMVQVSPDLGPDLDGKIAALGDNRYLAPGEDIITDYYYWYQCKIVRRYVDGEGNTLSPSAVGWYDKGKTGGLQIPEFEGYQVRDVTEEGYNVEWNEKNRCHLVRINGTDCMTFTIVYDKYPTITYTDGVSGQAFPDDVHENVPIGSETPDFAGGTPTRAGYTFVGWSPAVEETVTAGDKIYTAIWTETLRTADPSHPAAWFALMAAAGCAAASVRIRRRKNGCPV